MDSDYECSEDEGFESEGGSEGSEGSRDDGSEGSSVDSFATMQANLEQLSSVMKDLCDEAERLEGSLTVLHRPIENLAIEQFGDAPFMAGSAFRSERFALRPPGIPGADLGRRYTFAEICQVLRTYLLESGAGAVTGTGDIVVNEPLKRLFDIQETEISYIQLLGRLRKVLI